MRRIKLILGALTVVGASFAAFAGPAMADDLNCRDAQGNLIRCDGQFFAPVNDPNNGFFNNCGTDIGGIFFDTAPFNDCGFNNFNNFNDGIDNGVSQSAG